MKEKLKKIEFVKCILEEKHKLKIKKEYLNEYKLFTNYFFNNESAEKIEYKMLLNIHALEKGMTNLNPRPFGKEKVNTLINLANIYPKNLQLKSFAFSLTISILYTYLDFYEERSWTDKDEYVKVKEFLKNYKRNNNIIAGAHLIKKEDYIKNAKIDYQKFLESRHSVRNYMPVPLKKEDIKKAVQMALLSPSACNRQMCKIWHIKNYRLVEIVKKYFTGLGNFNLDNKPSFFLITFDMNNYLFFSDRLEGYFNAGLFSMNFVNALHSLEIGSCFLQFGKSISHENELKEILGIPLNHRIAIGIAAGYYDNISSVPYSTRKDIEEFYIEK